MALTDGIDVVLEISQFDWRSQHSYENRVKRAMLAGQDSSSERIEDSRG